MAGCRKAWKRIGRLAIETLTPHATAAMARMAGIIEGAVLAPSDMSPRAKLELVVSQGKVALAEEGKAARGSLLRSAAEGMIAGLREGVVALEDFGVDDTGETPINFQEE